MKIVPNWIYVCKKMWRIHKQLSKSPLRYSWPDENDPFSDWDSIWWVDFFHHFNNGNVFKFTMHTDYTPVKWPMFPALFNIFKDQYVDPSRGRKFDVIKDDDETKKEKSIVKSTPFMVRLTDWSEDAIIKVHSCSSDNWADVMNPDNRESPIWRLIGVNKFDYTIRLFIGAIDKNKVSLGIVGISDRKSNNDKELISDLRSEVRSLSSKGYVPMLIQCTEDDDVDAEVVYWMQKVSAENVRLGKIDDDDDEDDEEEWDDEDDDEDDDDYWDEDDEDEDDDDE